MTDVTIRGQGEVVQCPGCREKVIKTLYCLKCGYALYKYPDLDKDFLEGAKAKLHRFIGKVQGRHAPNLKDRIMLLLGLHDVRLTIQVPHGELEKLKEKDPFLREACTPLGCSTKSLHKMESVLKSHGYELSRSQFSELRFYRRPLE